MDEPRRQHWWEFWGEPWGQPWMQTLEKILLKINNFDAVFWDSNLDKLMIFIKLDDIVGLYVLEKYLT